jgi:hypothetical protein
LYLLLYLLSLEAALLEDIIGLLQGILNAGPAPVPTGLSEDLANLLLV